MDLTTLYNKACQNFNCYVITIVSRFIVVVVVSTIITLAAATSTCYSLCCKYKNFFRYFCVQIDKADYSFPLWFSIGAKSLIHRILDPNPEAVSSPSLLLYIMYC